MLVIPRGQGIKGEVRSRNDMTSVSAIIRTYEIYNLPQIEMLKLALPFNFFFQWAKKILDHVRHQIEKKKKLKTLATDLEHALHKQLPLSPL